MPHSLKKNKTFFVSLCFSFGSVIIFRRYICQKFQLSKEDQSINMGHVEFGINDVFCNEIMMSFSKSLIGSGYFT